MEQVKAQGAKVAQTNEHAADKAVMTPEQKAKKAEAAKAFNARQADLKAKAKVAAEKLKAFADEKKVTLPKEVTDWIDAQLTVRVGGGNNGSSFFNKVFGDSPKVGDKITLLDYMKKTLKAKADIDKRVKEWAEKGIVVEYKEDSANLLNSTYTIVKM